MTHPTRRTLIRLLPCVGVWGVLAATGRAAAQAKPELVDEQSAEAKALGYRADASRVDVKVSPKYRKGQTCANCALYAGQAGEASGGCSLFYGPEVAAAGWCDLWEAK